MGLREAFTHHDHREGFFGRAATVGVEDAWGFAGRPTVRAAGHGGRPGRYSQAVLEELHLRLQEQHLGSEIRALQAQLGQEGDVGELQRRLLPSAASASGCPEQL